MPDTSPVDVHGLLLAAGAGRRMGGPKALLHDEDGTSWLVRAAEALAGGGCPRVTVVLGAAAEQARALVPAWADVVVAEEWAEGMGASLRAGLAGMAGTEQSVLVSLVDLPDVSAAVVARVLATASGPDVLARASYVGVPGHPVLLGRDHWAGAGGVAVGDRGARDYLAAHEVVLVECGDLASGRDVDH